MRREKKRRETETSRRSHQSSPPGQQSATWRHPEQPARPKPHDQDQQGDRTNTKCPAARSSSRHQVGNWSFEDGNWQLKKKKKWIKYWNWHDLNNIEEMGNGNLNQNWHKPDWERWRSTHLADFQLRRLTSSLKLADCEESELRRQQSFEQSTVD